MLKQQTNFDGRLIDSDKNTEGYTTTSETAAAAAADPFIFTSYLEPRGCRRRGGGGGKGCISLSTDLGLRSDILISPSISPVPWSWLLQDDTSHKIRRKHQKKNINANTSQADEGGEEGGEERGRGKRRGKRRGGDNLTTSEPTGRLRRTSSLGRFDIDEDDKDEMVMTSDCSLLPRRQRRQAIFEPLGMIESSSTLNDEDISIQDVKEIRLTAGLKIGEEEERAGREGGVGVGDGGGGGGGSVRRKKSSADLGVHYPGDLLSLVRPSRREDRPLYKRNTISNFALNNKTYQTSTASLISGLEQDKKVKSSFSLLKLIDKKAHRSKDAPPDLSEVLQNIRKTEFTETYLSKYKKAEWSDLIMESKETSCEYLSKKEINRRSAVWELFSSECVFLIDHLMALKHCFMEPLKQVQVEGYLMFTEPQILFGNLDEVCSVSHSFCLNFISLLQTDVQFHHFGRTESLIQGLTKFSELTRNGEVYHDYCLNYSKALTYLELLRRNEDFIEFEKWCEMDPRCNRLQLTDLLISPMQHCTKVPLMLNSICKYTEDDRERKMLMESLEKLESSLRDLEDKMKWLKNYERVQQIQQQIVWQPVTELEPRVFIPDFIRHLLNFQPCERILASPNRQLLHEGPVQLLETPTKPIDMYLFLFDDVLLLTRVKRQPKKKVPSSGESSPYKPIKHPMTDGAVFVVHKQPISLDRLSVHDLKLTSTDLQNPKNAFVLVHITRFQQIIAVYTLQSSSAESKATWLTQLNESQERYKEAVECQDDNRISRFSKLEAGLATTATSADINDKIDNFVVDNPNSLMITTLQSSSPCSRRSRENDNNYYSSNPVIINVPTSIFRKDEKVPVIEVSGWHDNSSSRSSCRQLPGATDDNDLRLTDTNTFPTDSATEDAESLKEEVDSSGHPNCGRSSTDATVDSSACEGIEVSSGGKTGAKTVFGITEVIYV